MLPLKRRLRIPAQVKWTSVSAVACIITFMLCIHCVIAAAELHMVNRQLPADSIRHHESDSDDGQAPEDCKTWLPSAEFENSQASVYRAWPTFHMEQLCSTAW